MKTIYRYLVIATVALFTSAMFVQCADDDDNGSLEMDIFGGEGDCDNQATFTFANGNEVSITLN